MQMRRSYHIPALTCSLFKHSSSNWIKAIFPRSNYMNSHCCRVTEACNDARFVPEPHTRHKTIFVRRSRRRIAASGGCFRVSTLRGRNQSGRRSRTLTAPWRSLTDTSLLSEAPGANQSSQGFNQRAAVLCTAQQGATITVQVLRKAKNTPKVFAHCTTSHFKQQSSSALDLISVYVFSVCSDWHGL